MKLSTVALCIIALVQGTVESFEPSPVASTSPSSSTTAKIVQSFLEQYERVVKFNRVLLVTEEGHSSRRLQKLIASRWMTSFISLPHEEGDRPRVSNSTTVAPYSADWAEGVQRRDLLVFVLRAVHSGLPRILLELPPSQPTLVLNFSPTELGPVRLPLHNNVLFAGVTFTDNIPSSAPNSTEEINEDERKLEFNLWQTYSVNEESLSVVIDYGRWQPGAALTPSLQGLMEQRSDLLGTTLSCIAETDIYSVILDTRSDGTPRFTGWVPDLIEHLQQDLNFTCAWRLPPDREWGTMQPNGSWSGMIGELLAGRADVITTAMSLTHDRSSVLDFLIPLADVRVSLHMKAGSPFGSPWTRYTEEFSVIAWTVLVACILISILALVLIMRLSPRETVVWGLGEAFISLGGLFAFQGCTRFPVNASSRTLLLTFLMMSVLAQAHYSAFLYAKLTDLRYTMPFRSFSDILDDGSYTVGVMAGTVMEDEIQTTKNPLLQRMYKERTLPHGLFYTKKEARQRVRSDLLTVSHGRGNKIEDEKFLAVMSDYSMARITINNPCGFITLPIKLFSFQNGFAVQKRSHLTRVFNTAILKAINTGVVSNYQQRWKLRPPNCDNAEAIPINLEQTMSAFFLLVGGAMTAFLAFLCECATFHGRFATCYMKVYAYLNQKFKGNIKE